MRNKRSRWSVVIEVRLPDEAASSRRQEPLRSSPHGAIRHHLERIKGDPPCRAPLSPAGFPFSPFLSIAVVDHARDLLCGCFVVSSRRPSGTPRALPSGRCGPNRGERSLDAEVAVNVRIKHALVSRARWRIMGEKRAVNLWPGLRERSDRLRETFFSPR